MTYQETLSWMFAQLPMYQNIGKQAYKADLTNTILLSNYLNNPEKNLKCIHVAGTNGKGSTSHMLASILQEAGYKVGLYTSPHLKDFRERIKINGKEISQEFVVDFIQKHKPFFEQNDLSFFEMSVGLAFQYFANQKTDINIIEVGMGGRLDSTNIITPLVSVITNIGLDHTQFLGTTLQEIAAEKAGIIKKNVPIVIGEYTPETLPVFTAKAASTNSEIFLASDLISKNHESALKGNYQWHNKKTTLQTIHVLQGQTTFQISETNIANGFLNVITNTGLQGRWQQLQTNPRVIADTAHNQHGLQLVLNQVQSQKYQKLHIVLGVVNDKDLTTILPLFPKSAVYYFCKPNIPRGLEANILQQKAANFQLIGNIYNTVLTAYKTALQQANQNDMIYVGGSTFVVAEIL